MNKKINKNLLLVDDDESIRWVLNQLLSEQGHQVTQVDSTESAIEHLNKQDFDLIISDVRMSGKSGMELLEFCRLKRPNTPVIIMTAHSDLESAVDAYKKGAFEYLPKPFDLDEVIATVERALSLSQNRADNEKDQQPEKLKTHSIIGESAAMQNLYRVIGRLSGSQVSVLLHGESGTGKELVANALHQHSPRAKAPFIALNMAAIPKDLVESELFGHEKGAFTGASGQHKGRFEQANNGTLFLDEIGDMPLDSQTRLLRVLSEGTFYRLGSSQTTRVDVRIIAASHQDLASKVNSGEFREDLYHRLNVIPIHLPPLRERSDDIPLLADFFLKKIAAENKEPVKELSDEALQRLKSYNWPGNVRQLENTCHWLSVMAKSQLILVNDLADEFQTTSGTTISIESWQKILETQLKNSFLSGEKQIFNQTQKEFEKLIMSTALTMTNGKKAEASKLLGWGRNTLTRRLKSHE